MQCIVVLGKEVQTYVNLSQSLHCFVFQIHYRTSRIIVSEAKLVGHCIIPQLYIPRQFEMFDSPMWVFVLIIWFTALYMVGYTKND